MKGNTKIIIIASIVILAGAIIIFTNPAYTGLVTSPDSQDNMILLSFSQGLFKTEEGDNGRIWILEFLETDGEWKGREIVVQDSAFVHRALLGDSDNDGENEIVAACARNSSIIIYNMIDGEWKGEVIWTTHHNRIRDVAVADVDNDGENEIISSTHGPGYVVIFDHINGEYIQREIDLAEDMNSHEIAVGDVNKNGINEFYISFTEPEEGERAQTGRIIKYEWDGTTYTKQLIDKFNDTNAKELVIGDADNDNELEFVAILQGLPKPTQDPQNEPGVLKPTYIQKYDWLENRFLPETIGQNNDIKCRSVDIGDIDNDGMNEIAIGTHESGLQILKLIGNEWEETIVDYGMKAGIHAVTFSDIDNDGLDELMRTSDNMDTGNPVIYIYNFKSWEKITIDLPRGIRTWTIESGTVNT